MADVTFEVKGIKEVNQKLYAYSQQLGDRVVLASLMSGARIVLRTAKRLAPKSSQPKFLKNESFSRPSGNLRRSIIVRKSKIHSAKRGAKIGVYITIKMGKKYGAGDAYYGRFQEDGWEVRGKNRTVENTASKINRRGKRIFSRGQTGGRATLRSGNKIPGKYFMRNAFAQDKLNAVRMIIDAATAGAEIVARRTGLK